MVNRIYFGMKFVYIYIYYVSIYKDRLELKKNMGFNWNKIN